MKRVYKLGKHLQSIILFILSLLLQTMKRLTLQTSETRPPSPVPWNSRQMIL